MFFLASFLHAVVVGLYAVVFAGLTYLILRDRLRPGNPVLRLWFNTFIFCVAMILLELQLRLFSSELPRIFQLSPLTGQLYSFLQTPLGAELYFLAPVAAAGLVSILIFARESEQPVPGLA